MIKNKKNYIEFLEKTKGALANTRFTEELTNNFDFSKYEKMIKERELFVPVVGAFSAGKSTLLNAFLGKDYLSTGISPETALASEIRFSMDERIEAIKENGDFDTYKINDIKVIEAKTKKYKSLRYHINSSDIKNLEPLILVDMPGFGSPLDLHNQAILEFISKGVHYIVLNSCESGNITKDILKQLEFILDLDKDFSFFLSKTDLKPENDIKEISYYIKNQMNDFLLSDKEVNILSQNKQENFQKILKTINPEELFKNLFYKMLKSKTALLEDSINTIINTLNSDKEKGLKAIVQLQEGLKQIKKKETNLIKESKDSAIKSTLNISDEIENELINNLDNLAKKISREPIKFETYLQNKVQTMLREKIIIKLKEDKKELANDFAKELKNMSFSLDIISQDWTDDLKDNSLEAIESSMSLLQLAGGFNPYIALAISIIGNLVSIFLKNDRDNRNFENAKSQIKSKIIPDIISKLKEITPKIFNDNLVTITKEISKSLEKEFSKKEAEIKLAQKESEKNKEKIQEDISRLEKSKSAIQKNKKLLGL